jgi:hypothetical protein
MKRKYMPCVREFVSVVEQDFPMDHLGLGDKLLLSKIAAEEAQKLGKCHEYVLTTLRRMKDEFGYSPKIPYTL